MNSIQRRFELGKLLITPAADEALSIEDVSATLRRHSFGDWGDVTRADWEANDEALEIGERLLSVYHTLGGLKFWVITEADRSATMLLLPENY